MRKLLSVLLAATMVFGMVFGATAASLVPGTLTTGIRGVNEAEFADILDENASMGMITINDSSSGISSISDLSDLYIAPGDIIQIPLTGDMFLDSKGNSFSKTYVSTSALSSGSITVRSTYTTGQGMMKISLAGNRNKAYIKIECIKNPAFDGEKFSYAVYLNHRGTRKAKTRIAVKGVAEAERIEVDSSDDYVDISKGQTILATTNVRNMEVYLGNNCSVTRNLVRNREYSGIATTDILVQDEVLFTKYPYLEYIYRLETINLKAEGNVVYFDLDEKLFVYNTNGTYIGTTNESLPYWTKYYLTSKKYDKINVIR